MLTDTHAHLGGEDVPEREALDMLAAGMPDIIIAASYDEVSSRRSARIARENRNVFAMAGVHPCDSQKLTVSPAAWISELASDKQNKVVAIGEIGLDYHYDDTDREVQKKWFAEQIRIAHELGLPVSFHIRDAYEDAAEIFEKNRAFLQNGAVMHCYSGSAEYAAEISEKFGFYFSFSGVITFKNAKKYPPLRTGKRFVFDPTFYFFAASILLIALTSAETDAAMMSLCMPTPHTFLSPYSTQTYATACDFEVVVRACS